MPLYFDEAGNGAMISASSVPQACSFFGVPLLMNRFSPVNTAGDGARKIVLKSAHFELCMLFLVTEEGKLSDKRFHTSLLLSVRGGDGVFTVY